MLDAAERHARIGRHHGVDEDLPRFDAVDELLPLGGIAGPDAGGEAELRVIGDGDGLRAVAHAEHGGDGPERLVARGGRVIGEIRQHRRRVEVAAARAAGEQLPAPGDRLADLLLDVVGDLRHGQRADVGGLVERIADP